MVIVRVVVCLLCGLVFVVTGTVIGAVVAEALTGRTGCGEAHGFVVGILIAIVGVSAIWRATKGLK